MVYISKYDTEFSFSRKREPLDVDAAKEVIIAAAKKVGITAGNIGCSFCNGKLIPTANFMAQQHLQCEFTAAVVAQEIKIERISRKRL